MADHATDIRARVVDLDDARPRRWGWLLLVFGLVGGGLWTSLAPLDAGVSASGSVIVSGSRKAVQPLSAGQVIELLAAEGDEVRAGQLLVRLDDTPSRAQLDITQGQWLAAQALEARLIAERQDDAVPTFPAAWRGPSADPRATAAMDVQSRLFSARRRALALDLSTLTESLRGLEAQTQAAERSRDAKQEQLRLLREPLQGMRAMADEGYLARNRLLDQERAVAAAAAALSDDEGAIARLQQSIAETRSRLAGRREEYRKDVESQLADVQRDLASQRSRIESLTFEVTSTRIRAPVDGIVINPTIHTVGGVVAAGSVLMEVVPKGAALRVQAQIPPHLIDKVRPGLSVDILFPAFNQTVTPRIPGTVADVSADVLTDPRSQAPFYKAVVDVTAEGLSKLRRNDIRPGMPAEVFVRTGERTALNYLMKPLLDRLNRAMTEP